ncbi:MAG: adenosylcobinamide-GDP ribazoletransferase [Acidimicrobiales bacterium]
MTGLRAAAALLTRVPMGAAVDAPADLPRAVPWFPVVGGLVGVAVAGAYAGLLELLPALPAAAVAVAVGVGLTGALHEDGLADAADALGASSRDEALAILKDPTHGTFGVTALVLSLLVRVAAVSSFDGWTAVAALPAAHALARSGAAVLLVVLPAATSHGLGATYGTAVTNAQVVAAVIVGLGIGAVVLGPWVGVAAVAVAIAVTATGWLAMRKLGGMTGDVLGAAEQASEALVLLVAAAAWR